MLRTKENNLQKFYCFKGKFYVFLLLPVSIALNLKMFVF